METEELYKKLLFNYFSGKLTDSEKKELLCWIKEKEKHKYLMDKMSDWWAVAHVPLFRSNIENDFEEYFHFLNESLAVKQTKQKQFVLKSWMKTAAVFLLLIGVGASTFFIGKNLAEKPELVCMETVAPCGSQAKVILPDSSVVILNSGSSLKYRNDYNREERRVDLIGEACFDVKPDAQKPFLVCSDKVNVKVKGTVFNVKAYDNEETIDVVLISGKVNVQFPEGTHEDVSLAPDQKISYDKKEDNITLSAVDASNSILWVKGGLHFFEKPFPEIARELERKYNVKIEIRSKSLHKEVFSGSISSHYTLDKVIKEIDVDNKYRYTYRDGILIITDK